MKTPKAPPAPDPVATAQAQTATNIATAQANAILGNVNQVTPDGALTYTQSGSKFVNDGTSGQTYWMGPNGEIQSAAPMRKGPTSYREEPIYEWDSLSGKNGREKITGYRRIEVPGVDTPEEGWSQVKGYYIPQYTATQTLSPAQQAIKDQTDAAELNMGTIANQQSAFLKDYLAKPVSLDNEAVEGRLFELGRKRIDPVLASRRASLETGLANKGIQMGSEAWRTAMGQQGQDENDAYNQLALTGRSQSIQEILTERNQPLNEIAALLSGSQVSQPNFVNTNMPQIPTTDYAGLVQSNYQNQLAAWQQQVASKNATIGAFAGLAGAGLGGWLGRR